MKDVQAEESKVKVEITQVGIKDFKLPIKIASKDGSYQQTVADIDCFVDLDADKKGINMSRLPITLSQFTDVLDADKIQNLAKQVKEKSEARQCRLIYKFPYFVKKLSPVNNVEGLVYHTIMFDVIASDDINRFKFKTTTIATTLCPCSKEISENNAHNQKCFITIEVEPTSWVWFEDIINIAENSASCEIFSVLKRPDEKYVTEQMYAQPRFVEDVVREAYIQLVGMNKLKSFTVEALADESIHMHKAYAKIKGVQKDDGLYTASYGRFD